MTAAATIDLTRYPVDRPDAAEGRALIERCRAALAVTGACVLEGFLRPEALPGIVAGLEPVLDRAWFKQKSHNVYLVPDDPALPPEHPRNRRQTTGSATLGYDFVPRDSALDALYGWPPLVGFVARVLGFEALYPYADPLTPLNVLVYREGAGTGWHFDIASFVVTLLLQEPASGGEFDYAPFIRSEADQGYDEVDAALTGRSDRVLELRQPAGGLVLFRGSRTLHRVRPVAGPRPRLVAVLSYAPEPGRVSDPHTMQTFYGRVA